MEILMKKAIFLVFALLLTLPVAAQVNLNVFTGYSLSAFEDQEEAASAIPLGVAVGYKVMPQLEVGGEVNLALPGYAFESTIYGVDFTTTFHQNLFGVYGRYYLPLQTVSPFLKAGVGLYTGNITMEGEFMGEKMDEELDMDSAVGFNFGAGVMLKKGFYGEFNYTIVNRASSEDDEDGSGESFGANTWAIQLGYRFKL